MRKVNIIGYLLLLILTSTLLSAKIGASQKGCSNIKEPDKELACYLEELRRADKKLNEKYARIIKKIGPKSRTALQFIQQKWIEHRDYDCSRYGSGKKDNWLDNIKDKRKIWCLTYKTVDRIKKLSIYENEKLILDSKADVCTAIKQSMQANLYTEWFGVRKVFYITKTYGYTANKKKKYGIFRSKGGETIKVNPSTDTAWSSGATRLSPMFADLDGDGTA